MQYLYVVLGVLAVFLIDYNRQKKMRQEFINKIKSRWGKPSERVYTKEELEQIAYRFNRSGAENFLDDITWNDLDMNRIFARMNNTGCSAGQEYLYELLRTPAADVLELKRRDAFIDALLADNVCREKLQFIFGEIGKCKKGSIAQYEDLLQTVSAQSNGKHYAIIAAFFCALFCMLLWDTGLGMFFLFAVLGYGIIDYYRCKAVIEPYFICLKSVALMSKCCAKIAKLQIPYVDNEKMSEYGRLFQGESRRLALISSGSDYNGSLVDTLMDYVRMVTHIDIIAYNQVVNSFQKKQAAIAEMISEVGYMDAMTAIASYRCSLEVWTKPVFENGKEPYIEAADIYHPLLESPVKNSITAGGCILLTGSNASGKSTFLRTMAVNAIFAQTIFTCTAAVYRSALFCIYSSMSLQDDLLKGDSYFMVEIKAIKRILLACQKGAAVLCFVDEVLRGTNTVERIAASTSILKYLKERGALCFAATHDVELTRLLEGEYRNYHFEETVTEDDIFFNYCLQNGPAVTRNAIKLLKMMDYDREIVDNSERMAKEFLESGSWKLSGREFIKS